MVGAGCSSCVWTVHLAGHVGSVVSAFVNVVLDWFLRLSVGMGVFGAALASTLAVAIGMLYIVGVYLFCRARTLRLLSSQSQAEDLRLTLPYTLVTSAASGRRPVLGEGTLAVLCSRQSGLRCTTWARGVGAYRHSLLLAVVRFHDSNAWPSRPQRFVSFNLEPPVLTGFAADSVSPLPRLVFCGGSVAAFVGSEQLVGLFLRWETRRPGSPSRGFPLRRGFVCFVVNLAPSVITKSQRLPQRFFALFGDACFCAVFRVVPRGSGSGYLVAILLSEGSHPAGARPLAAENVENGIFF